MSDIIEDYVNLLRRKVSVPKSSVTIIGVCGGSGSGKSSISQIIKRFFERNYSITILNVDHFYKNRTPDVLEHFGGNANYDDPFMIADDELVDAMIKLKQGQDVCVKKYDYTHQCRGEEILTIKTADIIILEGIFAFSWVKVRDLCSLRVFVDCSGELRLMRRIQRDVRDRGRTVDSVLKQYVDNVKPGYEKFVSPQKKYAHLILPWENECSGTINLEALEILVNHISILCSIPPTPAACD